MSKLDRLTEAEQLKHGRTGELLPRSGEEVLLLRQSNPVCNVCGAVDHALYKGLPDQALANGNVGSAHIP